MSNSPLLQGMIGSPAKAYGDPIAIKFSILRFNKKAYRMEQYKLLAECLLPHPMLDWFELKYVHVKTNGDTQIVHLYLDENDQKPAGLGDLRPNVFTCESVFHDFPIRGHEALLHVRRCRWLDADGHNVMTECDLIQDSTRCFRVGSFLKEALFPNGCV